MQIHFVRGSKLPIMFDLIQKDFLRVSKRPGTPLHWLIKAMTHVGFRAVLLYRVGRWYRTHGWRWLAAWHDRWIQRSCQCCISTAAEIGPGFKISHTVGLVIGSGCIIGANCDIRQNVTLGGNYSKKDNQDRTKPILGNHISVGAGAVILGPVRIGDDSIIGANAVVTQNIPGHCIAAGVPARVIKERWDGFSGRGLNLEIPAPESDQETETSHMHEINQERW